MSNPLQLGLLVHAAATLARPPHCTARTDVSDELKNTLYPTQSGSQQAIFASLLAQLGLTSLQ